MAARVFDPLRLDVQALASEAAELSGHWPLQQFERLADTLHGPPADSDRIAWNAIGEERNSRGEPAQVWLRLRAQASLRLQCQRCLRAVDAELQVDRWLHFVPGEAAAAQMDADSEDDVLALTRALNLQELVEDELLLALPLVPRHTVCPEPLLAPGDRVELADEPANPFAALASLKRGGPLN